MPNYALAETQVFEVTVEEFEKVLAKFETKDQINMTSSLKLEANTKKLCFS